MPAVKDTSAPIPANHVRIIVRARGTVSYPWAGHLWPTTPTTYDAHTNEVRDFLAADPSNLSVTWPEDYVAPDGSMPGRAKATVETDAKPVSLEERVAVAERDAVRARSVALASERDVAELRARNDAMATEMERQRLESVEQIKRLTEAVKDADKRAIAATEKVAEVERGVANTIARIKAEHVGEIDTIVARHAAEMEALSMERDKLAATNASLTAELDRLTTPAAPKAKKPQPAPAPAEPAPVG